jgi:succinate dehydrogenase hydrophobic anchor subunit
MRNTYLQLAQMITGALVAVLLAIHISVQRLGVILGFLGVKIADPLAFESMMERARQGLWAGIYIALLAFGLFHALNGLRNILLETSLSDRAMQVLTWLIIICGLAFLVLGTYVPLVLLNR